ncbi:hypothetical protein SAMD00019534_088210, partial [Acytostelium subglobosum LB1]|uniref:hypothetical protein n=1 Tax=Acytostelium subglobosum LB1 TaxID=1410327 RepID=UPI000645003E
MMYGKLVDISDDESDEEVNLLNTSQHNNGAKDMMPSMIGGGTQETILKMWDEKQNNRHRTPHEDIKNISEKHSDVDRKISNLLSIIERPWSFVELDGPICSIEGELLKKKRFSSGWKKYYFALNGNNLYYYNNKNSKKPKGIISISFVSPPLVMSEKHIIDMRTPDVSKYMFQVFSYKRIDAFCATNNEDFERWNFVMQKLTKNTLTLDDYNERYQAFQEVYPLFEKKTELELDRLLLLLAEIDNKSTHIIGKSKKEKTGTLLMMEEDENNGEITWKQYYFALLNQCIYYYKSSKLPPQGVITLKYTEIQTCDTSISNDLLHSFKLVTPLSVFILKAKHQVAMEDWVESLQCSKLGRPRAIAPSVAAVIEPSINSNAAPLALGKKSVAILTFTPANAAPGSKPKMVKLVIGSNTVGRSESCNIQVDDKLVSRTHCKVEVSETACILLDMGSGHGTKINHRPVDRHPLQIGDVFKIGKTKIRFDVVKK